MTLPSAFYSKDGEHYVASPSTAGPWVSPLARALLMIDSANGLSAVLDVDEYLFVPVNLTVCLERYPNGEWVAMHAATSLSNDGVEKR